MISAISSPGLGSGLDVNAIVDKLISIEHRPIDVLQKQYIGIQTQLSSFSLLKSYMSNVQNAANQLGDPSLWAATKALSANSAALGASSSSTGGAAAGTYSVQVANLAQTQTTASAAVADSRAGLGAGRLHIELGSWNGDQSAFSPKAGATAVDIDIGDGQDSLEAVRDKINGAGAGVTASILRDASGARLVVSSSTTGQDNGFRISAQGPAPSDDGSGTVVEGGAAPPGLAALAFDPPNGANAGTMTQAACNASLTINGIALSLPSNTVDQAVQGLTLTLVQAQAQPVVVTVVPDADRMRSAINNLVNAYTDITNYIAGQTKYDSTTNTAAALSGDSSTLMVQKQLRAAFSASSGASTLYPRLLEMGVHLQADNTLAVDADKMSQALANPQEMAKAFAQDAPGQDNDGIAVRVKALAKQLLGFDGLITRRTTALGSAASGNAAQRAKMESRVDQVRQRLLAQYTALDAQMSRLNAQSKYVTQQLALQLKQNS